jgi:hypothetical protein
MQCDVGSAKNIIASIQLERGCRSTISSLPACFVSSFRLLCVFPAMSRFVLACAAICCALLATSVAVQAESHLSAFARHASLSWLDRTFSTGLIRPTQEEVIAFLEDGEPKIDRSAPREEQFGQMRRQFIKGAEKTARTILGGGNPDNYKHREQVPADEYPYWCGT